MARVASCLPRSQPVKQKIERRDRQLQEMILKGKKPIVMFVDEAHDLNGHTLTGLKRLMELAEDVDGLLSVVLAGHPKLRNDLHKDNMEEIGARTDVFSLDGITGAQREYIEWLLRTCSGKEDACESILTDDAIDLLASKLTQVANTAASTASPDAGLRGWISGWRALCVGGCRRVGTLKTHR